MSDKLTVLDDAQDFMLTCQKEDEADAIEWAIDQLRWRRVEDELPNPGHAILTEKNGDVDYWSAETMSEEDPEELLVAGLCHRWRYIELPEGE